MFGKCAKNIEKNPPKHECAHVAKDNLKAFNMYSFHGSLVERPHPIRGGGGCVFNPKQ
jgi:hypothetical protein